MQIMLRSKLAVCCLWSFIQQLKRLVRLFTKRTGLIIKCYYCIKKCIRQYAFLVNMPWLHTYLPVQLFWQNFCSRRNMHKQYFPRRISCELGQKFIGACTNCMHDARVCSFLTSHQREYAAELITINKYGIFLLLFPIMHTVQYTMCWQASRYPKKDIKAQRVSRMIIKSTGKKQKYCS